MWWTKLAIPGSFLLHVKKYTLSYRIVSYRIRIVSYAMVTTAHGYRSAKKQL